MIKTEKSKKLGVLVKNIEDHSILFETHFHPSSECQAEDYYDECMNAGVQYLVAVGSDLESSFLSRKYAETIDNMWFSSGVHPHEASKYADQIADFADFAKHEKYVAVGEIGLDYFYENSEREIQQDVFVKFLKIALEFKKPAIIHCRDKDGSDDAYKDVYQLMGEYAESGGRFVVHCFTGTVKWAEKFLEMGAYLGITGIVTFPKAQNVRDVLKVIPLERLLIETDTPYLAPVPKRGKTNHSKYLPYIAEKIAEEKGISFMDLTERTTSNAKKLFKI